MTTVIDNPLLDFGILILRSNFELAIANVERYFNDNLFIFAIFATILRKNMSPWINCYFSPNQWDVELKKSYDEFCDLLTVEMKMIFICHYPFRNLQFQMSIGLQGDL